MSEYIKRLENILEGVENYRFDDASCAEWEELTTHVLKGAIAREKANQEADELANSIWDRLERKLTESKLNENQEIVLDWLKRECNDYDFEYGLINALHNTLAHSCTSSEENIAINELSFKEDLEVMNQFCIWALDQC